jgi:ketosteroid isomerase-like protein
MRLSVLLLLATLASSLARAQSPADRRSASEIRALFEQFNIAWERRDSAFIGQYYAHDPAAVFFFERRQLVGWPRVDTLYRNMFAEAGAGTVHSKATVLDVGARGVVGWLAANFRLEVIEPSGDTTVDEGRETTVFERRNGRWQVVHRHTSFQAPPGPQHHVPLYTQPGPLPAAKQGTADAAAREIRRLRETSNAAIAQHDTAGIGATLSPNVVVVTSTSARVQGRDAYLQLFAKDTRPGVVFRRTPDDVRVFAPWRMASEHGHWTGSWTAADGPVEIGGSYFAKWRETRGEWLIENETFVPETCAGGRYCQAAP